MTHQRSGGRALVAAALGLLGATALVPTVASASSAGSVTSGPKALSAHQTIRPGDWIAVGYVLSMNGHNSAATIHVQGGSARFPVSCQQTGPTTQVAVTFPDGAVSIPANDNHWYPTEHSDAAASYELSFQAPNLCNGNPMWLGAGDQNGVLYSATLRSTDTTDQVAVQFHAVDANSLDNKGDIDCSSSTENPSGGGFCNGAWSPKITTTAAQYSTQSSTPPSQSTPPPSQSTPPPSQSTPPPQQSTPPSSSGSGSGSTPPSGSGGTTGSSTGTTSSGSSTGGGSRGTGATSGSPSTATPSSGMVVIRGISSPSAVLGLSTHAPAAAPAPGHAPAAPAGHPAPSASAPAPNTILSPVPLVVPSVAEALVRAGAALPWNWFIALALVDGLLTALIVVRRRRAAHPA